MLFTSIAINLAILLVNLLLSIRVQTTLLTSVCHALEKNIFFDVGIVVKNKSNVA